MKSHTREASGEFSTDAVGLPLTVAPTIVDLTDGNVFDLEIAPVAKRIGDAVVRMLAYNGSVPGPALRVPQGSEITVRVTNRGDHDTTVHWHGLRLQNRYDGVPHETQAPIAVGDTFTYKVQFPDPGAFWYHPHVREDYAQEMGLYGTIVVTPSDPDYWPPVNREMTLTVDDILIEDGRIAPFSHHGPDHTAMGRFGNVFLVNGETGLAVDATTGEVVRLYLTNTANTRVFRVRLPGARMKLVGGDNGRYEREELVEEVLLAPSERAVVDVLFEHPARIAFEHHTPDRVYPLGAVSVAERAPAPSFAGDFATLRRSEELEGERSRIGADLERPPDKTLAFIGVMRAMQAGGEHTAGDEGPFVCPMHPEVRSDEPGRCPKCGMNLVPVEDESGEKENARSDATPSSGEYVCPMHPEVRSDEPGSCPKCGMFLVPVEEEEGGSHDGHGGESDGIEWEDTMPDMNRESTPRNMRWKLVDRDTGLENAAIDWSFRVGERVKIRLVNEMDSDHPMHHPFHIHGAGMFLVLTRDGMPEPNLVWKDTVLVRQGETVDILLDVSNPGLWMAHCHIAEHAESGMMFSFLVAR
jgi:FtsP/CotA-like multicopper oxidase with cupredoxin domain